MRIRKVTIITIIGLIITLILQIGGLFYAYRSNMEAMQLTVNKNFAIAFYETNDNLANQLPYPDGTTIAYIPTAPNSKLSQDEQNLRTNEDLAQILKTEYKVEFPIDELATVLRKKLKIDNIDSEVVINKINNGINRMLDSTNPTFDRKVGVLKSEPFFRPQQSNSRTSHYRFSLYAHLGKNLLILSIDIRLDDRSYIQYHFSDKTDHPPTTIDQSTRKIFL